MRFALRCAVFLCALCASAVNGFALDREAFSFTKYDLTLQIDPTQQRLAVRGKITLRNDSPTPQKVAVLQITSSLDWRSIKAGGKPVQFVTQPFTSDIDHTGALSEAIVTLPQPVPPKATVELEIGYEGIIVLDATRLERIGAPEASARSSDWDQIGENFIALRGAGNVAWYPVATEVANLSEEASLFEVLGRWKMREAGSSTHVKINLLWQTESDKPPQIFLNGVFCTPNHVLGARAQVVDAECPDQPTRLDTTTLVIADYQEIERPSIRVYYLSGHDVAATKFADAAEKAAPFINGWFGAFREKAHAADLPNANAAPFESGSLLLAPLAGDDLKLAGLVAAHQLTHAAFLSFRPWIEEGLAHFAQALYLENEKGRQAALDYMGLHRSAFSSTEKSTPSRGDETNRSLINTNDAEIYRSKAMCVWWMLRDMVGDKALKAALASYRPEQDNEYSYVQKLVTAQTQRDLQWFFDDWVYHDRGLPDFKVTSAFPRKSPTETYLVTVSVDNLGTAGAEVPITVKFNGGDVTKRLIVRGKDKGVIRIEVPKAPQEVVVNDGSVPESDMTNNTFKIAADAN